MAAANRVLVYGGKGALGSACVHYFKSKGWVSKRVFIMILLEPIESLRIGACAKTDTC